MKYKNFLKQNLQPILFSLIVFVLLISATLRFTRFRIGQWEKDVRAQMQDYMSAKKSAMEKALYSRIYYTRGVAAYVSLNPEISDNEFAELAGEYIRNDSVINSMALSKDCILNAIYPFKGHEEALGLNLLEHPERKLIVEKTIETHETFVAGPVELVEGGIAFISYTPIFDKNNPGNEGFWGVTDIVIKQDQLLNEAGLKQNENTFRFALRGYNGDGETGAIFWGDKSIFENNPVKVKIELPDGEWILAAVPEKGWKQYADQDKTLFLILLVSTFFISILIGLFTKAMLRIRQNEKELKAIFASLDSLIIEFNKEGDYIKAASENSDLLYLPKEQLIGKNLKEIFDKEKADFFKKAIQNCINKKDLQVIEYPLNINGKEHWFSARISYKNENSIIYNAYDITESKKKEKLLRESERQLKELNETKDKFFSIIAHDLRSPLSGQKGIIDLIIENYDSLDESIRKKMLVSLKDSSNHVHSLLEDLLKWSMSQTGKIKINKQDFNLKEQFYELFSYFTIQSKLKNIEFFDRLETRITVHLDINLTEVILRNLISNAIKFTPEDGKISIVSEIASKENSPFLKINISDNGIGMSQEKLDTLFKVGKNNSTYGTAYEKGNGLGLILCKEFAEKQGCEITVESYVGKGSTFSLWVPSV